MNGLPARTLSLLLGTIPPRKIAYLKFILEGYDGLALLSTENPATGLVSLRCHVDSQDAVVALLKSLGLDNICHRQGLEST